MEAIDLGRLEIYQLGRSLSQMGWSIYEPLDWHQKKVIGDQFITAIDSYSANVIEAQGRYHYLDRAKFLFNARGSLYEALHWVELMKERGIAKEAQYLQCAHLISTIAPKLNSFINSHFTRHKNDNPNHK